MRIKSLVDIEGDLMWLYEEAARLSEQTGETEGFHFRTLAARYADRYARDLAAEQVGKALDRIEKAGEPVISDWDVQDEIAAIRDELKKK
jgi:hypothetical protein